MMKLIVIGALWSLIGNFSRKKRKERDTAASYDHKSTYFGCGRNTSGLTAVRKLLQS